MTTTVPAITEITLIEAIDRGIPNKERIALRIESTLDIGSYALVLGLRAQGGDLVTPLRDTLFWFGSGQVTSGDWIVIYTGSGESSRHPTADERNEIFVVYWGRKQTLFHDPNVVPVLWRVSGIQYSPPPIALPQR